MSVVELPVVVEEQMTLSSWTLHAIAAGLMFWPTSSSTIAQPPAFDGRGWTIGHRQENGTEILTEYVRPGQTVENWQELVTSTVFHQAVPIDAFVNRLRSSLAEGCPSLVWNLIQQDQRTAIYEFRDDGCGGFEATSEIDRVTIESDRRMYRLAYAAKTKGPLAPTRRKEWLDILTLVPPAEGLVGARPAPRVSPPTSDEKKKTPGKTLSTEELAAGVQKLAWPCPAGVKSEVKGQTPSPKGVLTVYYLECSNGQRFGVLVDPSGSIVVAAPQNDRPRSSLLLRRRSGLRISAPSESR